MKKYNHLKGLRWYSTLNDWMDVLIIVHEGTEDVAARAILEGIDAWWETEGDAGMCYGDSIETRLIDLGIFYISRYHDSDEGEFFDDEWEAALDWYESQGIEIDTLDIGGLYISEC